MASSKRAILRNFRSLRTLPMRQDGLGAGGPVARRVPVVVDEADLANLREALAQLGLLMKLTDNVASLARLQ